MEGKRSLCLSEIFIVTFFFYFLGGILGVKVQKLKLRDKFNTNISDSSYIRSHRLMRSNDVINNRKTKYLFPFFSFYIPNFQSHI